MWSSLRWLALFATAFGYLEAAVVVYLRAIYYPDGFAFPLALPETRIGIIEIGRETATLIMLLGAAALVCRTAWGRFGAFAFAFGVWDLVFYASLKLTIDWPASLATWDVLFLIPGVWTGPVWSAVLVAVFLVFCGARMVQAAAAEHVPSPGLAGWVGGAVSLALLLTAFLWNHGPASSGEIPGWFPWPLWLAGVLVGLGTFFHLFGLHSRPKHS